MASMSGRHIRGNQFARPTLADATGPRELTHLAFANILRADEQAVRHCGERIMSRTKPLPVILFVGVSQTLGASWAVAQEGTPPAGASTSEPALEEVVVTGSRIKQSENSFANPVTSFSADVIAQSGKTDLADFLAQSPALVGSVTGDLTAGSNPGFGEVGLNLLDLRHLGVDRTLVLVDGRRHVSGLAGSAAVDIDAIPTDLLQTVDVLTGGASAIYGADGVSGVVNFRLRKDFEGLSVRGQTSTSSEGDGENQFLALTAGMNFSEGRGNVAIAYEYSADDRVNDQDRDYLRPPRAANLYQNQDDLDDSPDVPDNVRYDDIRYADSSPMGAVDVDFDLLSDFEGNGNPYDRGFVLENSGGYTVGWIQHADRWVPGRSVSRTRSSPGQRARPLRRERCVDDLRRGQVRALACVFNRAAVLRLLSLHDARQPVHAAGAPRRNRAWSGGRMVRRSRDTGWCHRDARQLRPGRQCGRHFARDAARRARCERDPQRSPELRSLVRLW